MTIEEEIAQIRTLLRETAALNKETAAIGAKTSERLDRLTERHQGLAESVELLLHEGRDILRRLGK